MTWQMPSLGGTWGGSNGQSLKDPPRKASLNLREQSLASRAPWVQHTGSPGPVGREGWPWINPREMQRSYPGNILWETQFLILQRFFERHPKQRPGQARQGKETETGASADREGWLQLAFGDAKGEGGGDVRAARPCPWTRKGQLLAMQAKCQLTAVGSGQGRLPEGSTANSPSLQACVPMGVCLPRHHSNYIWAAEGRGSTCSGKNEGNTEEKLRKT